MLGLGACSPPRALEAMRVLGDVAAGEEPSRLKAGTPEPRRWALAASGAGDAQADLYWPGDRATAALVLVPGAARLGKDDPRLVAFAHTLARARFAVLVPDIANLRTQRLSPDDARAIAAAIHYFAGCFEPAQDPSIGLAAISYAAGPALLAALAPTTADRVGFAFVIGGYYDVEAVLTFFTTGYFRDGPDGRWRRREPNAYGKWMFVRANAARLASSKDRVALDEIAARKLDDLDAGIADLRARLGPEGRAVMALLDNRDPERVPALIAALPAPIRADLRALDLQRLDFSRLPFELILVHGRDDPIIPSTESEALAAAAPADRVSLYLVDHLAHVELNPAGLLDGLELWQAIYRILAERDSLPAPELERCPPE
jgi:hypothetical protein